MLEDNFLYGADEALGQITGTSIMGDSTEKGEPVTFITSQRWFYGLHVIKQFMRDKGSRYKLLAPLK